MEALYGANLDDHYSDLAHHYSRSGNTAKAVAYLHLAGRQAAQRSANAEAVTHLMTALELLTTLPDTHERTRQELRLHLTLGGALQAITGFASPEVKATYTRAQELSQQLGETRQFFAALVGLRQLHHVRGEFRTARELGEQLLNLAQREQDPALLVAAHSALGNTLLHLSEFSIAQAHLEQCMTFYEVQRRHSPAFLFSGFDFGVAAISYAALALWYLGYPDQALEKGKAVLSLAQELSHPFSLAAARVVAATLYQLRRERALTHEWAEATITLALEHGFPQWLSLGTTLRGWAMAEQGQVEEGIAQIHQGHVARQAIGAVVFQSYVLALLAEAYGKAGQAEEGLAALAEALTGVDKTGERFYEAELYRLRGELTLAQSRVQRLGSSVQKEAEECFLKAIEIAQRQQAKSLELRATMSLACLWQQSKQREAQQLLSEIYGWFTEGFDTKDLQEAKVLLEELTQ
jgi:predicted ATPase